MSQSSPQGSGGGGVTGTQEVVSVSGDYTASDGDVILADASGGALTITLFPPDGGAEATVKKVDTTGNTVTIARPGGEEIDGDAADRTITGEDTSRTFTSDGTNYFII